jgi:hypothetical protein
VYSYVTNYGGGVVLAPAGAVFLSEVAQCAQVGLLPGLTNLGELGNSIHVAEGWTNSDHNPFVRNPAGLSYIRAFDFGGPVATWSLLIEFWNYRYAQKDGRVYWPGYTNSNLAPPHGLTIWYSAGLTRQGSDGAHAHLSLGRANTNTSGVAAWTPALDSLAPWGLEQFLRARLGGTSPAPADSLLEDFMAALSEAQQLEMFRRIQELTGGSTDGKHFDLTPVGDAVMAARVPWGTGSQPLATVAHQTLVAAQSASSAALRSGKVDPAAVAQALAPLVNAQNGVSADDIAKAVVSALGAQLSD